MKKHLLHLSLGALFAALAHADGALAVEVAPRISDREIIERLTGLEEGQKRFEQRMDAMQKQLEQRMDAMQKQLEQRMDAIQTQTGQRFASMEKRMDAMQAQTEQRFASMEKRMEAQWNLTLVMIGGIFGLIGFVVWDRKTALKPLEARFARIAHELERDLDVGSPQGSRLNRLIAAIREFAPDDPRLAEHIMTALERHSLPAHSPEQA